MTMTDLPEIEITSAAALWDWLDTYHAASGSVWLVTRKKTAGDGYVSRDEVLDALIAFGWTDGRRKTHADPARTMQLVSPRKQQVWAQTYRLRAARLIEEGRMRPAGQAAIDAAIASGRWTAWQDVDALDVPPVLQTALDARPGAADWFAAAAPSYRRNVLRFLRSARRAETQARRAARIADHAARGEKLPQY